MKTEKNILCAFLLNLLFSVFEFIGGFFTGSIAIISDSLHDLGDALGIGISYFLEKKSKKQPDDKYTYGYRRFSVLGGLITTIILLTGSLMVIYASVLRIINPSRINYNGMVIFAIIGFLVNSGAAFFTHGGNSLNQKAVHLHMLEDVLGWAVVLIGALIMNFTDFSLLDPIMSIGVALFILVNALKNLRSVLFLFLEKIPNGFDVGKLREHILGIEGIKDVHHIHIRSLDGQINHATMHIVCEGDNQKIKEELREELLLHGISHVTIEQEAENEHCSEHHCNIDTKESSSHHSHHHHH